MVHYSVLPPLALYVHLPWCVRKCPYCDFNSHELRGAIDEHGYVDALLRDLDHDLTHVHGRTLQSIFIGGGTPSLFAPESIARLLDGVRVRAAVGDDCEITLEANPGTVELERFRGFRAAGVNRLSIGIQSFEPEKLTLLGRIHGRDEALAAAQAVHAAGFDNFNLDLMYGLPGQTEDQALADLRTAIECAPAHLSLYQLTIEPNTLFHARPPQLPDDDTTWAMQERLQELLARHGYAQYEVSAYARVGRECRHNRNYWEFGDYLGLGAGAHAKLTYTEGVARHSKLRDPKSYLAHAGSVRAVTGARALAENDLVCEFMLNALRLTRGFRSDLYTARTGLALATLAPRLAEAEHRGLLVRDANAIRPTDLGRRFLNDLLLLFLPDARARRAAI